MTYQPPEKDRWATQAILNLIKPGDVINVEGRSSWWDVPTKFAHWAIRTHQRALFSEQSNWRSTHCMLYLDPFRTLSVEPPRSLWLPLHAYCRDHIIIWRYTKREFSGWDIATMRQAALPLIETKYDVGQLADIALNHLYGHPMDIHYEVFDGGKERKVCSVGVRLCFEYLRKQLPEGEMTRLFSTFDQPQWEEAHKLHKLLYADKGVAVEATAPGHFANSHFFDNEFRIRAEFDLGVRVG